MIDLNAPIQEVMVYSDRALVTRRGTIHLEAGEHELRIATLPNFIRDSLRASGKGPQGTSILNVDVNTTFYSRPPEAEIVQLQTELEGLEQRQQLLEARREALNDRRKWLRALGEQSRDFAKGLAQGQMKPQDCADFFQFAAQQALQDAEAAQSLEAEMKLLQQEIEAKQRELLHKGYGDQPDRLSAVITVALPTAGDVTMELSYLILGASWHPQYDVRVQTNDEQNGGEVEVTYMGVVQQFTGEAWERVALSLSTARPSLAAVLPELDPWYINVFTPPPVRPMPYATAIRAPRMAMQPMLAADGEATSHAAILAAEADETPAPPVAAVVATAAMEHAGPALVFRAGRSVDIPSDNSPHKTTIARDNLPCTFDYVSAPALEENAHLRATITNTTPRMLLQGEAHIFLSGEYVGTTQIENTAPSERFKVFLGIDDNVKVKRELIERSVDKGVLLQNDLRRITYAYRIIVHNYAAFPRDVVVRDHLPVSQHERVKVKVQSVQPQATERTKLELLTWQFTLPPDGEQKIEYRFVVEHPQDLRVVGLP